MREQNVLFSGRFEEMKDKNVQTPWRRALCLWSSLLRRNRMAWDESPVRAYHWVMNMTFLLPGHRGRRAPRPNSFSQPEFHLPLSPEVEKAIFTEYEISRIPEILGLNSEVGFLRLFFSPICWLYLISAALMMTHWAGQSGGVGSDKQLDFFIMRIILLQNVLYYNMPKVNFSEVL